MDLKSFKINRKFKKREHQPDADLYWHVIVCVALLAMAGVLYLGLSMFLKINAENFSGQIEYTGQSSKISKARVGKALDYFNQREEKSKNILESSFVKADPAI